MYLRSKRYKRQFCHFEMLYAERDPDNRYAKQQPEGQMHDAQLDSANQNPNDITDSAHHPKPARRYIAPERPQHKPRDLHTLHAEWYANDRNAQQQPYYRPYQRYNDASKY